MSFFEELKRRNVFRVALGYIVLGWLLLQVTDVVVPILELPDWVDKLVLFLLVIGFPMVLFFAWAYELTPEGVKREQEVDRSQSIAPRTGRKLDFAIIAVLAMALAWFAWDKFAGKTETGSDPFSEGTTSESEERSSQKRALTPPSTAAKSIAVLPFVAMSSGEDDGYFADGLTEEILNSLAQLPELLVTARTSSFSFKGQDIPVQQIAETLGVRHIVEGSVRRSGDRLRVTVQLVRAADGFHVWSENYDSTAEDTIQVQEDIAEKIAKAMNVVMDDQKREAMREAGLRDVEAFITMQKAREFYQAAHGDANTVPALRQANKLYEQVLARVPGYPPALEEHSDLYIHLLNDYLLTGRPMEGVSAQDIEEARVRALEDVTLALENARNFTEQNEFEINLAMISGNWRGVESRLQRYYESSGCSKPSWSPQFALLFGDAAAYAQRISQVTECDPLLSSNWFDESRAWLWAGDPERALAVAREGMEVAPGGWIGFALLWALTATGQFEELGSTIERYRGPDAGRLVEQIHRLAAMGQRAGAEQLLAARDPGAANWGFQELTVRAHLGDREEANRIAARIDKDPWGPTALISITLWCMCGAPWDLEVTPNFAARLSEAGFDWPPPSPITWPLKTW